MTSSNPENPPFQTPQPEQLQSEEVRASTLENLSQQKQGSSIENELDPASGASPEAAEAGDDIVDRQIHIANRSPG